MQLGFFVCSVWENTLSFPLGHLAEFSQSEYSLIGRGKSSYPYSNSADPIGSAAVLRISAIIPPYCCMKIQFSAGIVSERYILMQCFCILK